MKRMFFLLLALALLVSTLPISVYASVSEQIASPAEVISDDHFSAQEVIEEIPQKSTTSMNVQVIDSGTCGDDLVWTLNDTGLLTISGSGKMYDYTRSSAPPWENYKLTKITALVIEEGVTSIGDWAFSETYSITSVTLPSGLTSIGGDAFKNCPYLQKLFIPATVTNIGTSAFALCNALTDITLEDGFTSISDLMFWSCKNLQKIDLPASITEIQSRAFDGCTKLKAIEFIGAAPTIADDAFKSVTAVISYPGTDTSWDTVAGKAFGATLTWHPIGIGQEIGGTFSRFNNIHWKLEDHTLYLSGDGYMCWEPTGQCPWEAYKGAIHRVVMTGTINNLPSAFANCVNLEDITFNPGLTQIGDSFENCISLKSITIPDSVTSFLGHTFRGCTNLETVILSNNITQIDHDAFSNCTSLKSITIPASVKRLLGAVFANCTALETVYFMGNMPTFNNEPGFSPTFKSCKIVAYYPANNKTWTASKIRAIEDFYADKNVIFIPHDGSGSPKVSGVCLQQTGEPVLSWLSVENIDRYEIYRATSKSGKYTLVATVTECSWIDLTTTAGKTYYYKVKGICDTNPALSTNFSLVVTIASRCQIPDVTVSTDPATGRPLLTWTPVSGASKYEIYWTVTDDPYNYKKLTTTTKTSYLHEKAPITDSCQYKVRAVGAKSDYTSPFTEILWGRAICAQPAVTVKIDPDSGKPCLSWKKVDSAVGYRIMRQLPGEEDFTILAEQTALTFLDTNAPIDTRCIYILQTISSSSFLDSHPTKEITVTSGIARPSLTATVDAATGKPTFTWTAVEGAVNYAIYRSTKSTSGYSLLNTINGTSFVDDSASVGKTYYYKLVAAGNVGNSAETAYVKLLSKCATPTIAVENGSSGKPVVSWEKVSGAKKYTVYRATSETGKYSKLGTTTKLSYTDSKAKTGTEYFYKVIANASSSTYNSGYSNIESCNVICSSVTVTAKVDAATGKPSLSWKKVDGAAGYRILRQLPGEEDFTVIKEQTSLTFLDTSAPIDTKCIYLVQVMGKTAALDSQMSAEISVTSGIAQPKLTATINADGKPEISWQAVEGAVTYEVYRSTKSNKSYSLVSTIEGTSYVDNAVAPGKTYYYKVIAVGAVSKSAESAYAKLSGKCATPTIQLEIDLTSGKPSLSWKKIEGAKQYTIYRATSENGKYSKVGTTKSLTYTDSKATVGTTYFYKIVANASSSKYSSDYSNVVSGRTICATPVVKASVVAATGKPQLSWSKVTGAKEYWIFLDVDGQPQLLTTTTKLSFTDEAAVPGETRTYAVWAVNADPVCNSPMQAATVTATCAQPKIKGKVGEIGKPEITWDAVEGATRYVIYRSTKSGSGYEIIGETEDLTTYEDLSAVKGKTYYYKVVAVGYSGAESLPSAYAKVKSK